MPSLIKRLKWFFVDQFMFHISGGGGGGSPAPAQQTVNNTSIPTYAQPYVETMLGQTAALTDINQNPYQTYGGQRIAEFSPLQQQAMTNVTNMQTSGQLGTGTDLATQAGYGGLSAAGQVPGLQNQALNYGASGAMYGAAGADQAAIAAQQAQRQAAMYGRQGSQAGQVGMGYGQQASNYGAGATNLGLNATELAQQQGLGYGALGSQYGAQGSQYGAQAAGLAPQAQQYGAQASDIGMGGLGYGLQGAIAGQQAAGYGAQGANIGQNVANMSTNPYAQQAYMSPYIQNALQPQLAEMTRQYDITGAQEKGRATAAGAFGGTRNSLMQAENERNKNMAMNQAIGSGYQNAFTAAQNQMNQAATLGMQGTQQGITGQQGAMQGAGVGLSGISSALQGQQGALTGLGQAGNLYGQGMQGAGVGLQGAGVGLQGLQGALAGSAQGLQGYNAGIQGSQTGISGANTGISGAQAGLSGVGQQLASGQLGLSGAQTGMQGAQSGLSGIQGAIGAGQYGLSALGTAGSAAGTLGQLGQTQFGQQTSINQQQATAGAVQQAQAQQALDTAYQDFMSQKNYPYQQLAFQSDMLRGIPLSQSAQTQYTAPANAASQLGGLGMSALGIYGMSGGFKGSKDGGLMSIKGYAEGGQIGYAGGGDISALDIEGLKKMLANPNINPLEAESIKKRIILLSRMKNNPQAEAIMSPALERSGIASIGTGEMVPEEMAAGANGGIVAFAQGGLKRPETEMDYTDLIKKRLAAMDTGNPFAKSEAETQSIRQSMEERKQRSPYEALAMAGLGTMAGTSQYGLSNLGLGGIEGLKNYGRSQAENAADQKLILQQQVEAEKGKYARDTGNLNALIAAQGQKDTKEIGLLNARNTAGLNATSKQNTLLIQAQNSYNQALDNAKDTLLKQTKFSSLYRNDPAAFNREAKKQALAEMSPQVLEILGMKPTAEAPPAAAPAKTVPVVAKTYPPASAAAISALKLSKDQTTASKQFDDIFGPGAAAKALSK